MTATDTALVEADGRENGRKLALLRAVGLDKLAEPQRELALHIARKYELDLMMKHLVMIEGRPYITRDGLLHVAHRSGQLDGIETTQPAIIDDFWQASCSVYRKDMSRPFTYTGRYPTRGGNQKYAPEMAVKVAEVMSLRRAFDVAAPTAEERWDDATVPVESASAHAPSLAERAAAKRAEVDRAAIADGSPPLTEQEHENVERLTALAAKDELPRQWGFERFREAITAKGVNGPTVKSAVLELWPDRNLTIKDMPSWDLTPAQWADLADVLSLV